MPGKRRAGGSQKDSLVVISRGDLTPDRLERALGLLGDLNLATSVLTPQQFRQLRYKNLLPGLEDDTHEQPSGDSQAVLPPLAAITSREDYLTVEHYREFRAEFMPEVAKRVATTAFYACLDTYSHRKTPSRPTEEIDRVSNYPTQRAYPSLIVVARADVGLPPPQYLISPSSVQPRQASLDQYAIQTGSLVDLGSRELRASPAPGGGVYEWFIGELIDHLQEQLIN